MAPIRVGLIGLSSTVVQGLAPGRWGRQHLNSLLPSPKYRIVALCNSSIDSARKAIAVNNLPLETMAYGSPDDMARDPDVDLVVVCVRVGKHLAIAKPALLHKKDILVEWPLGASIAEVEELANLAKEAGVKTAVGVQSRADPVVRKLRELISTGAVGEVVSSMMWVGSNMIVPDSWQEGTEYFLDINSGGSLFQILFGHVIDGFTAVVGDFATVQSVFKTSSKTTRLLGAKGEVINLKEPITTPDTIFVQGILETGAAASLCFRTAQSLVDDTGYRWIISGTEGEIGVTMRPGSWSLGPPGKHIRVKNWKRNVDEEVEFAPDEAEYISVVQYPGTNTARMYEAFAEGDMEGFASFESALRTHRLLDRIARGAAVAP